MARVLSLWLLVSPFLFPISATAGLKDCLSRIADSWRRDSLYLSLATSANERTYNFAHAFSNGPTALFVPGAWYCGRGWVIYDQVAGVCFRLSDGQLIAEIRDPSDSSIVYGRHSTPVGKNFNAQKLGLSPYSALTAWPHYGLSMSAAGTLKRLYDQEIRGPLFEQIEKKIREQLPLQLKGVRSIYGRPSFSLHPLTEQGETFGLQIEGWTGHHNSAYDGKPSDRYVIIQFMIRWGMAEIRVIPPASDSIPYPRFRRFPIAEFYGADQGQLKSIKDLVGKILLESESVQTHGTVYYRSEREPKITQETTSFAHQKGLDVFNGFKPLELKWDELVYLRGRVARGDDVHVNLDYLSYDGPARVVGVVPTNVGWQAGGGYYKNDYVFRLPDGEIVHGNLGVNVVPLPEQLIQWRVDPLTMAPWHLAEGSRFIDTRKGVAWTVDSVRRLIPQAMGGFMFEANARASASDEVEYTFLPQGVPASYWMPPDVSALQ